MGMRVTSLGEIPMTPGRASMMSDLKVHLDVNDASAGSLSINPSSRLPSTGVLKGYGRYYQWDQ